MDAITVDLSTPPTVMQVGLNRHGRLPEERFRMRAAHGLHLYLYHGWLELEGRRHDFAPGSISLTPPQVDVVWHFPKRAAHYYAHVRLPADAERPRIAVPIVTPPGDAARLADLCRGFELAIANHRAQPGRTTAWMWDLLWSVAPVPRGVTHLPCPAAGQAPDLGTGLHPSLHAVLTGIEEHLDGRLELSALAEQAGVSRTHLIRLFRRHCGTTVMGWIRQRRMERAGQLLRDTSVPIQSVAAAVGIPDLHRFNKLVRGRWGMSPSRLRRPT